MKVHDSSTKSIGRRRCVKMIPSAGGISGVIISLSRSYEVSSITGICVHVKCDKTFLRHKSCPCVPFVARLPYRVVLQTDKDSLKENNYMIGEVSNS